MLIKFISGDLKLLSLQSLNLSPWSYKYTKSICGKDLRAIFWRVEAVLISNNAVS